MITITKGPHQLEFQSWDYPDKAVGVRLDINNHRYRLANRTSKDLLAGCTDTPSGHQTITARIQGPRDVMELVMVTDALRRWDNTPIQLVLPTMPYGRQDRVCTRGEAHSLCAFANIINGLGYQGITTFDPHSDVTRAVFNNLTVIDRATLIGRFDALNKIILTDPAKTIFVAPDAGANKTTAELAKLYNHTHFIRADKLRDLATGKILETIIYGDVSGLITVICDDLCDGGASFIGLSKVLKAKGAVKVILYVTHGLFTKGVDVLFEAGIDEVYTTNAYRQDLLSSDLRFTVLDLDEAFGVTRNYLTEDYDEDPEKPFYMKDQPSTAYEFSQGAYIPIPSSPIKRTDVPRPLFK